MAIDDQLPYIGISYSSLCSILNGSEQAILSHNFKKEIPSTTSPSDLRIRILRKRKILVNQS
ncbi:hypothetical protein BT93_B0811 [Corymbia citriodora subsp. variegata]|nr:hypothetical protein BT93_B0811 [Corymbia citriodora subsp. variegata]